MYICVMTQYVYIHKYIHYVCVCVRARARGSSCSHKPNSCSLGHVIAMKQSAHLENVSQKLFMFKRALEYKECVRSQFLEFIKESDM